jgi:hypothetical protein
MCATTFFIHISYTYLAIPTSTTGCLVVASFPIFRPVAGNGFKPQIDDAIETEHEHLSFYPQRE